MRKRPEEDLFDIILDDEDELTLPVHHVSELSPDERIDEAVRTMNTGIDVRASMRMLSLDDVRKISGTDGLTPEQKMFVMALSVYGTETRAAIECQLPLAVIEKWMNEPAFSSAVGYARVAVADLLEEELLRRAMGGSDVLLMKALEANRPEKYAPKKNISGDVNVNVAHSWADLAKKHAQETLVSPGAQELLQEGTPDEKSVS